MVYWSLFHPPPPGFGNSHMWGGGVFSFWLGLSRFLGSGVGLGEIRGRFEAFEEAALCRSP